MRIAAVYSFNDGQKQVAQRFPDLLVEVNAAIKEVDSAQHKTKESTEKTMLGRMLFSPGSLNLAFKKAFFETIGGWQAIRVPCAYPDTFYADDYVKRPSSRGAFREMDFVKNRLGVEVQ